MGLSRVTRTPHSWYKAAKLLVQEELPVETVAERLGITRGTLYNWRRKRGFQKLIIAYQERLKNVVFTDGIAQKVNRLRKLDKLVAKLDVVMEERAIAFREALAQEHFEYSTKLEACNGDPAVIALLGPPPSEVPGGKTGLVAHERKGVGAGSAAEVNDVYTFDSSLHKAYLDTLQQAAKEMGGVFEETGKDPGNRDPRGAGTIVQINFPVASPEQIAEMNNAQVIDLPPQLRRLTQRPSDGMPL